MTSGKMATMVKLRPGFDSEAEEPEDAEDILPGEEAMQSGCGRFFLKLLLCLLNLGSLALGAALIYYGVHGKKMATTAFAVIPLGLLPAANVTAQAASETPMTTEAGGGAAGMVGILEGVHEGSGNGTVGTTEEAMWVLGDPFNSLIGVGTGVMVMSLLGIYSGCSGDRHGLFAYYTALMLMTALLAYVGTFCFLFAKDANKYDAFFHSLTDNLSASSATEAQEAALDKIPTTLLICGLLCLGTALLLLVALYGSSRLMGHGYAAKRMSMAMNLVTAILGGALLYLAILTSQASYGGQWAAIIVAVAGGLTVLLSLIGYFGLSRKRRWMLIIHATFLCAVVLLFLVGGIVCLAYRQLMQEYLSQHWALIQDKLGNVDPASAYQAVSNHMVLIGAASLLLLACLLFNLCTTIYTLRTNWRHWSRIKAGKGDSEAGEGVKYHKTAALSSSEGEEGFESDVDDTHATAALPPNKGGAGKGGATVKSPLGGKELELQAKGGRKELELPAKGGRKELELPPKGGGKGAKSTYHSTEAEMTQGPERGLKGGSVEREKKRQEDRPQRISAGGKKNKIPATRPLDRG